jgi:hypothetical protein
MARVGDGKRAVMCVRHNKLRFETENEARLQLLRAQLLHTEQGKLKIEKRHYPCELGGFHLTSWEDKAGPK